MPEIKINIDNLEQEIICLKSLANKIKSTKVERPQVVGGGSSIQALENIGLTFENMQKQLSILVTDTASFMSSIKDATEKQDKKIASDIKL